MYSGIETLFRTTIERNPTCWMAYNNLGAILESRRENWTRPRFIFTSRWNSKPTTSRAYHNLGLTLLLQSKRSDEAMAQYQRRCKSEPTSSNAYNSLGQYFATRGQFDKAIASYQKALALEAQPENVQAHNNLGEVLARGLEEATRP